MKRIGKLQEFIRVNIDMKDGILKLHWQD
jgi:hypothetical protein